MALFLKHGLKYTGLFDSPLQTTDEIAYVREYCQDS